MQKAEQQTKNQHSGQSVKNNIRNKLEESGI